MTQPSRLKRLKNRLRPEWFKAARKWVGSRLKLGAIARQFGLAGVATNPLAALKRSDTLFVLGSGASINDLGEADWARIAAADSVGFNNWHLHPFLPSLYINEPGKDLGLLRAELANLVRRGYGEARVPILLKDMERYRRHELVHILESMPAALWPQVSLSWDWEVHEQDRERFRWKLRWLHRLGIVHRRCFPILRKRASVFYIVLLALRAGYKNVVLCGIDLNNGDYFYESRRQELLAEGYWLPAAKPVAGAHKTDDPDYGAVTISAALDELNREVLQPSGLKLSVAFRSSGLHPLLPDYFGR